jgi:hypothetical protein
MYAEVKGNGILRYLGQIPHHLAHLTSQQLAEVGILPVVDVTRRIDPLVEKLADAAPRVRVRADRVELSRPSGPPESPPTAADLVIKQIEQIETNNPMTARYERERDIQLCMALLNIPAELFDPTVPISTYQPYYDALPVGGRRMVDVEREIRQLRAQLV